MFAWLGKAQEEIGLSCISFRCTSGRNIVYLCFCVCVKNVYSGNTTPNTGINQLVPWCSLWMLIKHYGHLSYFLSIGGSTCKCKKKKKKRALTDGHCPPPWLEVCSGFHWFAVASIGFSSWQTLHTMQSQRRCKSKLVHSGEIYLLLHFIMTIMTDTV